MCFNFLAKEVQLFPCLGLYSGIFAMYLQCPSKKSRTAIILFYAVCLLYVLSTASFVSDLGNFIFGVSNNSMSRNTFVISVMQTRFRSLSPQLQSDSQSILFCLMILQSTTSGCCDFLAQCILVSINYCTYRLIYY